MKLISIGLVIIWGLLAWMPSSSKLEIKRSTSLAVVQEAAGEDFSDKKPKKDIEGVSEWVGEDIVKYGFSKRDGQKKAKRQSKHFVCTSCHNLKKEDPDLANPNPEDRLVYTNEKGLPFLQATSLYGAVNRETYYNGDYEKKYGELVAPARNSIRGAIQLCAVECAQGRKLKDWEVESVLAYLWKIDLKIGDLNVSDEELASVNDGLKRTELHGEVLKLLSNKYAKKSDATFLLPPEDRKIGTGLAGNPGNGKLIYENSCLHCHYQKRYSFMHLDKRKMSFKHLNNKMDTYHRHSIYQVVRYGTYSKYGKKSYMPNYTKEKMSEQQLADLRSYIEMQANEL